MKNSLGDLHNILFEQLEKLNDNEIMDDPEKARKEIVRAKAMAGLGTTIVNGAKLQLDAVRLREEYSLTQIEMPEAFKIKQTKPAALLGGKK